MNKISNRRLVIAAACSTALLVPAAVTTAPAAQAATCSVTWGSTAKSNATMKPGPLTGIRAGRNTCFDRLVFDVKGSAPGYYASYVSTFTADASGQTIPLRGGAKLSVSLGVPSYGPGAYAPSRPSELANVSGFNTFRQVAWGGSFEGRTLVGIGVRARLPFRVFVIPGTTSSRVVVDVAHSWR